MLADTLVIRRLQEDLAKGEVYLIEARRAAGNHADSRRPADPLLLAMFVLVGVFTVFACAGLVSLGCLPSGNLPPIPELGLRVDQ